MNIIGEMDDYISFIESESDSDMESESVANCTDSTIEKPQSTTHDKLRDVLNENQQFENLNSRRKQFGFENVRASVVSAGGRSTGKSSNAATVTKRKRSNTSKENANHGQPTKKTKTKRSQHNSNNGQTSSSPLSISVPAATVAAVNDATAGTSAPIDRENDVIVVDIDDDANGEINGQRKVPSDSAAWKIYKVSKSQHLKAYFDFKTPEANKKMKAKCKLCGNNVCGTSGNNSNFLSHLRYVSTTLYIVRFFFCFRS